MKPFRFLPHSVTSDVAFEATGQTPSELFENAAGATFSVMCDIKKVEPKTTRKIELETDNLEDLLYDFLNELIFLKDRDGMLFSRFEIIINNNQLRADVLGEKVDPARHNLGVDVKAVTKHNFSISKVNNAYKATVVLDI